MEKNRLATVLSILAILAFLVLGCELLPGEPAAGVEMELWVDDPVVPRGGCTLLHWEVGTDEEYPVFLNGEEVALVGQEEVCLEEPTTFELVVGAPGGPHEEQVTVEVEGEGLPEGHPPEEPPAEGPPPEEAPPEGGPEVIVFEVHPDAVPAGECAMLFWEVHPPEWPVFVNGHEAPPAGEEEVCPEGTTTFELFVEAPGGPHERTVTLTVGAEPPPEPTQPPPQPTEPPPQATQPPPQPTQPPPAPSGADVHPTDLYADSQPQGVMWVRVTNDGPGTLTNKKVEIGGSYQRSTLTYPPSAHGSSILPKVFTVNLAPGQTQNINLGWQIDASQYYYDFTVTVTAKDFTDPNSGNNSYSEGVGPAFSASFANTHICGSNLRYATFRLQNTGTMKFESQFLTINPGLYTGGSSNSPFVGGPNGCPPGASSLAPGATAYTAANIGTTYHGSATAIIKLCTQDNVSGACVERRVNFTVP